MSKYGLNDESTGFKNGLYKIAVIVFMVVMILKSCTDPDKNGSDISLMIVSLIFIMLLFFLVNRRESDLMGKNDNDADFFGSLLESGEYFSSMDWQFRYSQYTEGHKPCHLSSGSLGLDLILRYFKKVLRRDFYIPLVIFPLVGGTFAQIMQEYGFPDSSFGFMMFCITAVLETVYFGILYYLSQNILRTWIKNHPRYQNRMKEINGSYLSGDAFECSYFCLVVGPKYVHGFDGERFHTVLRENITSCAWDIERLVIYSTGKYGERYVGDEYRFSIKFHCKDEDMGSGFKITLDQFQIKMIMEKFFPDVTDAGNPVLKVSKTYGHRVSGIKNCASGPIL